MSWNRRGGVWAMQAESRTAAWSTLCCTVSPSCTLCCLFTHSTASFWSHPTTVSLPRTLLASVHLIRSEGGLHCCQLIRRRIRCMRSRNSANGGGDGGGDQLGRGRDRGWGWPCCAVLPHNTCFSRTRASDILLMQLGQCPVKLREARGVGGRHTRGVTHGQSR